MLSGQSFNDTIVALATPHGVSALAVIRVTGPDAIATVQKLWRGKDLTGVASHTAHVGMLAHQGAPLDEVVLTVFRAPRSFTREDSVEISCHGSPLIARRIIQAIMQQGARLAAPGEFTQRAFLHGRFDLAQAEAVADLIQAETDNARIAALNQMRGGFSREIKTLREELIRFASLIELELDFGEEDVEFARRSELRELIIHIQNQLGALIRSFDQGNVIKNGIPTVIAGKPNAGKSTLLNVLLNEEKAIVSDIPGTTRDAIEDEITLGGIAFRFIDTAGLRETSDRIEAIGVQRTLEQMKRAALILYLFDLSAATPAGIEEQEKVVERLGKTVLKVGNKLDLARPELADELRRRGFILIAASQRTGIDELKERIVQAFHIDQVRPGDVLVTNLRHFQSLQKTTTALAQVLRGLDEGLSGDLLAIDIRHALHALGEVTGEITTDDLLESIFSKFCIGK
jgi:tRNA modification GTPase